MTKNKEASRYFSDRHEKSVCRLINAQQTPNSGATLWKKGDLVQKDASLLVECKCKEKQSDSVSIKKDWLEKNMQEAKEMHLYNSCVAFDFGPDEPHKNYFVINESLMKFLVEKLEEAYKD